MGLWRSRDSFLPLSARCSSPPARPLPAWQLTKRALVGGDTEKVALEWANEQVWAGCTGQIAGQERSRFPQYWPFPASPRRRAVNQKRREFVAGSYGSSGHSCPKQLLVRQAGLVTGVGYDAYMRRIVFPLEGNLYGRSLSAAAPPDRKSTRLN